MQSRLEIYLLRPGNRTRAKTVAENTIFELSIKNYSVMSDSKKIREIEAMLVVLSKRIEKLEKRSRLAPSSSYLKELKDEAARLLKYWN